MAKISPLQGLHSEVQFKKIGQPNGLGEFVLGWSSLGERNDYAGYYQRRHSKRGITLCRMRPYWPKQNPGEAEQARRALFADGVAHWHTLSISEKAVFERDAYALQMTGFNLHQRRWLRGEIS